MATLIDTDRRDWLKRHSLDIAVDKSIDRNMRKIFRRLRQQAPKALARLRALGII